MFYRFTPGRTPLLVSMPHCGVELPVGLADRMTPEARTLPDTDWHIPELYDFLADLDANVLRAEFSRYVVDLNRAPDGTALYPGASNTEICPTTTFADAPIYLPGQAPDAEEIAERIANYWQPYHQRITDELLRLRAEFGYALLFDAHSICSQVPRFFSGRLPDLNFGTADHASAPESVGQSLLAAATEAAGGRYSAVLNGRFKGGFITRHYGRPSDGVLAVQLELAQCTYMQEDAPYPLLPDQADELRPVLKALIKRFLELRP